MKKRLLSILLTACMVLTLLPTVALAAGTGAFTVTGGTYGMDYSYASNTLTILTNTEIAIANTDPATATTDKIVVSSSAGANITLAGVNIDLSSADGAAFDIASTAGEVNLILADGATNTLKSGFSRAGLQKDTTAAGTMLTISGNGTLNANGGFYAAGIGGGISGSASNIVISGGTVTAKGGFDGAGIGGGAYGIGSNIVISGGNVNASYIGGGYLGSASNIVISGGNVNASSIGATPTNSDGISVYKTTFTVPNDTAGGTDVSAMTFTSGGSNYTYGMTDAKSILDSGSGKVYVYLPEGAATATYDGTTYAATVTTDGSAVFAVPDPDIATVAAAETAAAGATYADTTQAACTTEAAVQTYIKGIAETAVNDSSVTVTVTGTYTAPTAGTSTDADGTNGSYVFTVTVSKGSQSQTTGSKTIAITATAWGATSSLNLTGVGCDVAAGKLTGTTANMEYQVADGVWTICTAPDTSDVVFSAGAVKVRQTDETTNERTVITIEAPAASSAPTLLSKTSGSVTLTDVTGYEYSKDGGVTWQDSNSFFGLSSSTAYSFVARIKATATTLPGTVSTVLAVTTSAVSSGDGTGSGSGSSTSGTGAPVIVDGKTENIGAEKKSGDTTTVTVDQSKLSDHIGGASSGSSVVVPVSENGSATASLVVKNIEDMAAKGMTLAVQTGSVAYNLNTSAIDTAALAAAFPGADMSTVPFDVTIANSSVSVEGETLVLSPVEFTVTATYNGKTVGVDTFSAYIDRVIEVTAEQAAKITTAVVVNADGSTRHVPTNVIEKDGKYYAIINSRTNSTYALIQNEVTFADASGEWYEAAVNEMGSRKIIEGRSASVFDGEASITRAEFAAILVRALGLPADGTSSFSDVSADAWYTGAVATAVQYGLTKGKDNNRFDPNANITRQEAMLMLQRAAALTEFTGTSGNLDSFADADSVGDWAEGAAKWSIGSGLIQGSDGKLNPTANITRAESATIILRLLQKAGLVDVRSKA
ncbi:putative surface layer protein [Oscillibacter valericigenes Sjm18-20]|nr:putative surface layer protein [Oscillibacter valericigenes Sjm18-20]